MRCYWPRYIARKHLRTDQQIKQKTYEYCAHRGKQNPKNSLCITADSPAPAWPWCTNVTPYFHAKKWKAVSLNNNNSWNNLLYFLFYSVILNYVLFHICETLTCFAIVHISSEIDADKRNFFQATMTCSRFGLSFHQCQE